MTQVRVAGSGPQEVLENSGPFFPGADGRVQVPLRFPHGAELTERESGTTVQVPLADLAPHVREAIAKSLVANR